MLPTSEQFKEAIYSSHRIAAQATVLERGLPPFEIQSGSVTLDVTAPTRGQCELTFSDPSLAPTTPDDPLSPYGNEIFVERGIIFADGTKELVPLGVYQIQEATVGDDLTVRVSGVDRSQWVIDASFEAPYPITGGTDYLTALKKVITDVYPATFDFAAYTASVPSATGEEQTDRWGFVQDMAHGIGMDLFFDNRGVCKLQPTVEAGSEPDWWIVEGNAGVAVGPSLLSAEKVWTRVEAHNRWIVVGDNPDNATPPRAVATDSDDASPTKYGGPFGIKPAFYSSGWLTTTTMCQQAADGQKARESGTAQTVNFGALVNPALEPSDTVLIKRTAVNPNDLDERVVVANETHIIDSLTIPLEADGTMTANTRARRIT